jgi:hypothetical protein
MSDSKTLERRYRRLLALYPRAFRRQHEDEMLVVLLACARNGRRRPGLADSADLIRNAVWIRLRPDLARSANTMVWAIRLMFVGAALELVALFTVVATQGAVHSAILRTDPHFTPAQWHTVFQAGIAPVEIAAPIVAAVWLLLAWANGRGHAWGRIALAGLFALTTVSMMSSLAAHVSTYAPADLIAGTAVWLVAAVAMLLTITEQSGPHYARRGQNGGGDGPGRGGDWAVARRASRADTGFVSWN